MTAQNEEYKTPIYLIAGFLESGKTSLIKNMLEDDGFSAGERTLIIQCEEGIEELDASLLKKANAVLETIDELSELTYERMTAMNEKYAPERIIIEYNSVWGIENLFKARKPEDWELAQMVAMIDATTFDSYMTNMRQMMSEAPKLADLVIFNRCTEKTEKSRYRRMIKAMNNTCNLMFENTDGTADDGVGEEDLPYDMKADIIEIKDEDFGIWYIDCMEHPDRYNGRTVRIKAQAFKVDDLPKRSYLLGRYAMTCCAADVGGIGLICRYLKKAPKEESWVTVTAKCEAAYSQVHGRDAIVLIETDCVPAEKPEDELVYFNR